MADGSGSAGPSSLESEINAWHEQLEEQQFGPKNRPAKPNVQVALGNEEPVAGRRIQFNPSKTVRNIYKHGKSVPHGTVSHKTRTKHLVYLNTIANLQKSGLFQEILSLLVADSIEDNDSLEEMIKYARDSVEYPHSVTTRFPGLVGRKIPVKVKREVILKLIAKYIDLVPAEQRQAFLNIFKKISELPRATMEEVSSYMEPFRTPENRAYANQVSANAKRQIELDEAEERRIANLKAGIGQKRQAVNSRNNKKSRKRRGRKA